MLDGSQDSLGQQGRSFYKQGEFEEALGIFHVLYEQGSRDFNLIQYMIQCYVKLQNYYGLADFLAHVVVENEFAAKEHAQLYYRLGLTYFKLDKINLAREAFWQVHKLNPDYPKLDEKLQAVDKKHFRTSSRYDLLIQKGTLTKKLLEQASEKAKVKEVDIDQILIDEFKIAKKDLGESLSAFYGVPFVSYDVKYETPFEVFEKRRLEPEFLKRYKWVPLKQNEKNIEVLMANPFDLSKVDEIRFILGTSQVDIMVALKQDIDDFVDNFFKDLSKGEEFFGFDEEISSEQDKDQEDWALEETSSEEQGEIVRLVNALLVEAWKRGASDIHIEPNARSKYCIVRLRVDGTCHELRKFRFSLSRSIVSRLKIMSRLDIAEKRLPQDGKIRLRMPQVNKVVEFRVATLPTIDGQEDVVLRLLASGKPMPLEKLGLADRNLNIFQDLIRQPYGMVLVVGPTGSGKTTTLHSALNYINTIDRKIWTAEDPVEITQDGLRQVQISPKIGLTFASILRSFLRADPDVIMIGEMRDKETAHIGVEASLTGHLVFSTLHTNSAPETVTRLLDMDLDPFNFSDSLLCVLAQRLVKTLCPYCKEAYTPDKEQMEELKNEFGSGWEKYFGQEFLKSPKLYRPKSCKYCFQGYKGRLGIHELMINSDQIKHHIKFQKPTEEIRSQAKSDGMLTLKQDGILKVIDGITDVNQVRSVAGKN